MSSNTSSIDFDMDLNDIELNTDFDLQPETVPSESLQSEIVQSETLQTETLQSETFQSETVQSESLQLESFEIDSRQLQLSPQDEASAAEKLTPKQVPTKKVPTKKCLPTEKVPKTNESFVSSKWKKSTRQINFSNTVATNSKSTGTKINKVYDQLCDDTNSSSPKECESDFKNLSLFENIDSFDAKQAAEALEFFGGEPNFRKNLNKLYSHLKKDQEQQKEIANLKEQAKGLLNRSKWIADFTEKAEKSLKEEFKILEDLDKSQTKQAKIRADKKKKTNNNTALLRNQIKKVFEKESSLDLKTQIDHQHKETPDFIRNVVLKGKTYTSSSSVEKFRKNALEENNARLRYLKQAMNELNEEIKAAKSTENVTRTSIADEQVKFLNQAMDDSESK